MDRPSWKSKDEKEVDERWSSRTSLCRSKRRLHPDWSLETKRRISGNASGNWHPERLRAWYAHWQWCLCRIASSGHRRKTSLCHCGPQLSNSKCLEELPNRSRRVSNANKKMGRRRTRDQGCHWGRKRDPMGGRRSHVEGYRLVHCGLLHSKSQRHQRPCDFCPGTSQFPKGLRSSDCELVGHQGVGRS